MTRSTRAWLEITRISNLPTVLSGALVVTLGGALRFAALGDLIFMLIAISCFYVAGFIFNDVFDRHIDADERRHRPIPSGRIRTHAAVQIGVLLLAAGLMLVAMVDQIFHGPDSPRGIPGGLFSAVLLIICMLLYNRFHASSAWTVFLMAACRVLVYMTCILVSLDTPEQYDRFFGYFFSWSIYGPLTWYLIAIFLFVAGFSRIARGEVAPASGATNYCYHCGQGTDTGKSDRCTECGKTLEQDKLARSTRPPLGRTIEWLSLAATFAPLIILTIYFVLYRARFQAWSTAVGPELGLTLGEHLKTVVYGLLLVLVGCWFVVAAVRYCRDRTNPGRSILMWLAGIPLVDAVLAYELHLPWLVTAICLGLFLVTIWGHRRIAGT
jgi:4-hydroxybenzoate polyprenyltransferase